MALCWLTLLVPWAQLLLRGVTSQGSPQPRISVLPPHALQCLGLPCTAPPVSSRSSWLHGFSLAFPGARGNCRAWGCAGHAAAGTP